MLARGTGRRVEGREKRRGGGGGTQEERGEK